MAGINKESIIFLEEIKKYHCQYNRFSRSYNVYLHISICIYLDCLSDECLRTKLRVTENRSFPFLHFCYINIYIYIYIIYMRI